MNENTIIYICKSCRIDRTVAPDENSQGMQLLRSVRENLAISPIQGVEVREINCLSQCENPAAVTFVAPEKFSFIVSSLEPAHDAAAIIDFAQKHYETPLGRVKSSERPEVIRQNLKGRIPPMGWVDPA